MDQSKQHTHTKKKEKKKKDNANIAFSISKREAPPEEFWTVSNRKD